MLSNFRADYIVIYSVYFVEIIILNIDLCSHIWKRQPLFTLFDQRLILFDLRKNSLLNLTKSVIKNFENGF